MSAPRAYTKEEVRESFLESCRAIAAYWSRQPEGSNLYRCEGVVHSMLTLIDGMSMSGPAMTLTMDPHADDKQFHIDEDENWIEPGMAINDDCLLNDMFYKHPETVRDIEPFPAPVAYLLTRLSGFSWAAMPREISPVVREMLLKDNVKFEPLYAHSAPVATLSDKLDTLLERAHVEHQVITVDLIPREPFAMGSYSMCGSIRPERVS